MARFKNTNHREVREAIKKLVADEDKFQPLSDKALLSHILKSGIKTNPWYIRLCREQQNIPPSQVRREEVTRAKA